MDLDYDTHLKPATQLKKTQGENIAINYLLELLFSNNWKYYDHWSILDKMAGYFKKANDENKKRVIVEFQNLIEGSKPIDYYAKVSCYKRLAGLYEQQKDDEKAFQMLSGAAASNHPESSNYLLEASDTSLKSAQILARKNLLVEKNAANYLYWHFAHLLYTMAWYRIFPNDERPTVWKSNIDALFPFEGASALQAFSTLSKNKSVESFASQFQELLFETFPQKFANPVHQTVAVGIVDQMVNDFLKTL